ncbi:HrpJ domain-containing protein [Pseudovibrio sp. Tun.PSC04-5.I4]|uniref:HrpJ domain-containing protein n=1 Tax=Pseudovibrio sp. Tun.PSC04-5.I4 TaxID=1798213 RepID=UPI0008900F82|nr:HrpJ domain-containing protein [Pseudovibrio sp. Tun.PSC04-5.I4]SDR15171.1 HrpJ-like domain-containing protein [Pseudovibrio sp. Tun.PSC04-5.I4]
MSLEVLRSTIATHNAESPVGAPLIAEAMGQRRNERVMQLSNPSKLTDAAEELGQALSSRLDKRSLEVRSVRQGQGTNIEAITRIAEFYDKLPDLPSKDKLQGMVNLLQDFQNKQSTGGRTGGQITPQDVFGFLQQFDGDVTHQYAALQIAIEHFETTGADDALLHALLNARKTMESGDLGKDVRAGLAVAKLAHDNADDISSDPATVRKNYREMLRNEPNFGIIFDRFRKLISRHRQLQQHTSQSVSKEVSETPLSSFDDVVNLFTEAARQGLEQADTQDEPAHLEAVLTELGKLKSLRTVFEGVHVATKLTGRSSQGFSSIAVDVGLEQMASDLFHYLGKSVAAPADAQGLVAPFAPAGLAASLSYTNNLLALHRDVPETIITNDNIRVQQFNTLLGLSEQLTILEEEQYQTAAENPAAMDNAPPAPSH